MDNQDSNSASNDEDGEATKASIIGIKIPDNDIYEKKLPKFATFDLDPNDWHELWKNRNMKDFTCKSGSCQGMFKRELKKICKSCSFCFARHRIKGAALRKISKHSAYFTASGY